MRRGVSPSAPPPPLDYSLILVIIADYSNETPLDIVHIGLKSKNVWNWTHIDGAGLGPTWHNSDKIFKL